MTTLGGLFDSALAHLTAAAARRPVTVAEPDERAAALAAGIDQVLLQIRKGLGPDAYPPAPTAGEQLPTPAAKNLDEWLTQASARLNQARQYLHAPGGVRPAGPSGTRIEAAAQALAAVRDTIGSHFGPDRAPLTPYAHLLSNRAAVDHIASRYAEVARAGGQVLDRIAQAGERNPPAAAEAFAAARACLDKASALTRATAGDPAPHLAAFPHALPVIPVQDSPDDPTTAVTARLAEDSERLSMAAYTALHDRDQQRFTGPDLHHTARWNSLTRLLACRVLLTASERLPDADRNIGHDFAQAATALRQSAAAWEETATAWHDVADPREHPPLPGSEIDPHPATVISRTTATRLGRLLFGAHWSPMSPPGPARPADEIFADTDGPGPLAASLYRLPSTGWQLACVAPRVVERAGDAPSHRPRMAALTTAYSAVMAAEQRSAGHLLHAARRAGTAVPRAVLDASAHWALATEQRSAPTHRIRPAHHPTPCAAIPQQPMTGPRLHLS
ncbi:hypothetical protein [Streptomyces sp. NPDC007369]|uniref:hypothetical protein n=1 Tax=Streptomyces sp. NPDC007369 TaxID=3154589 RepID=UPI00340B2F55